MTFASVTRVLADEGLLAELQRPADAARPGEAPQGNLPAARRLYARIHLGFSESQLAAGAFVRGAADTALMGELARRLGHRYRGQPGWSVVGTAPEAAEGTLLQRADGLLVTALDTEFTRSGESGNAVVHWPSLERGGSPGWAWFTGKGSQDADPADPLLRIYIAVAAEARADAWCTLMEELDDQCADFSSKVATSTEERARPDGVVVYCTGPVAAVVLDAIETAVPGRTRIRDRAGFGTEAAPGVSIACPGEGEDIQGSLGMQRSELIWEVMRERGAAFSAPRDLGALRRIFDRQEDQVAEILNGGRSYG